MNERIVAVTPIHQPTHLVHEADTDSGVAVFGLVDDDLALCMEGVGVTYVMSQCWFMLKKTSFGKAFERMSNSTSEKLYF